MECSQRHARRKHARLRERGESWLSNGLSRKLESHEADGTVFLTREGLRGMAQTTQAAISLVPVLREPVPTVNAGAIAIPEPDSN